MISTIANFAPPVAPAETGNFRTDTDTIREYLVRRYLPYLFNWLSNFANFFNSSQGFGADVASAASIKFTSYGHVVTGTSSISSIAVPGPPINFASQLVLCAADGFSLATGGNIASFRTVSAGTCVILVWNPKRGLWYPAS